MRELKIRAWDAHNNKMIMPGHFSLEDQKTYKISFSGMDLMQYTGLKDKNGKEIYERDIFKDDDWWVEKATVEFVNGIFGFWSDGKEEFIPLFGCKNIEVIGNIYETKEV
jgi:hypothetical protein